LRTTRTGLVAIADGEANPGDRLPPARHLAAVMGVNTNTVLRAVRLLRDEGLLELRQGHGIRVVGTPERSALLDRVAELVQLARRDGYPRGAGTHDRECAVAALRRLSRCDTRRSARRAGTAPYPRQFVPGTVQSPDFGVSGSLLACWLAARNGQARTDGRPSA